MLGESLPPYKLAWYAKRCFSKWTICCIYDTGYTVKKDCHFPIPSRDVTDQTLPGREYFNFSRPGRVWSVTSRLGNGKIVNLFYGERIQGKNLVGNIFATLKVLVCHCFIFIKIWNQTEAKQSKPSIQHRYLIHTVL